MIVGEVNAKLEPVIPLTLLAADGRTFAISAVVDTGYAAFLTLPPNISVAMGFQQVAMGQLILADGAKVASEIYSATILWDGRSRRVEADTLDTETLVGVSLMKGYDLNARIEVGGPVTIASIER